MDLLENPFCLLEVTTRDPSQKIVLAAEEKSLLLDPDVCTKAQTTLINPSQRLHAEISWLPGLSPGKVTEIIKKISTSPIQGINDLLSGLPYLAYCNLAASYINQVSFKDNPEYLVQWISYIVKAFESIDSDLLHNFINEDRTVARFPLIQSKDDVEQELYNHKDYLAKIFKTALDKIPDPDIHLTEILKQAIQNHDALPLLLDDLTELYHIEVQKYLDQLTDEVDQMISSLQNDLKQGEKPLKSSENITSFLVARKDKNGRRLSSMWVRPPGMSTTNSSTPPTNKASSRAGPEPHASKGVLTTLYERIGRLEGTLKAWDQIAKPINLVKQNSGLQDEHSINLASQIRELALFLANKYGLHAEARLLTSLMAEVFEKLPQVFEKTNEDIKAIDDILSEKGKAKKEAEEWEKEISLDIEIGRFLKKRLIITPESISFSSVSLPLKKITSIR
jgi:hypothetical protein